MLIQCTTIASTSLWRSLSAPMPSASSARPLKSLKAAIRRTPLPWALCSVIFPATIVYQEAGTPLLPAENDAQLDSVWVNIGLRGGRGREGFLAPSLQSRPDLGK